MDAFTQSSIFDVINEPDNEPFVADANQHQSKLAPENNKFHVGNGEDGKHYWLTPPDLYASLHAEFKFTFDPCPWPKPDGFDGLTQPWGASNYVNPPFGSIIHDGKKKGPTAWVRKAIAEQQNGNRVVLVYPVDKWVLMLLQAGAQVRNLGDVKWLATEDGSPGKGTGRHIACFVLEPEATALSDAEAATTSPDHIERAFGQIVFDWKLAWSSGNLQAAERYFAAANALEAAYPEQVAAWRRAHGGQA